MDVLEGERGRFSLLYAAGRKRRVFLSLVAAFDIPRSLSVAKKNDTDHERVSFLGVQGSGFKVQGSGVWWRLRREYMGRYPKVTSHLSPFST